MKHFYAIQYPATWNGKAQAFVFNSKGERDEFVGNSLFDTMPPGREPFKITRRELDANKKIIMTHNDDHLRRIIEKA